MSEVESALAETKKQLDGERLDELKSAVEELQQAAMKIGQSIYKNTGDSDSADNEPGVEEAEYEEDDKDKK